MKSVIVAFVLMASGFLVSWSHRSLWGTWFISESLPWSRERDMPAGPVYEFALLFVLLFAVFALSFVLPRWRQQNQVAMPPLPPRYRMKLGAAKLAGLFAVVLVSLWMGEHIQTGLEFNSLARELFGVRDTEMRNAAAFFTATVGLGAIVLCAFILFGTRRVMSSSPSPALRSPGPPLPIRRP